MNSLTINRKTFETIFNFNNMDRDCCSVLNLYLKNAKKIEDYRSDFYYDLDKIIECEYCKKKDMNNEMNFISVCFNCNVKCCMDCYEKENYDVCNDNEKREDWICFECGIECDGCNEYVSNDYMRDILDNKGNMEYRCCNCLNDRSKIKDIVFEYEDERYLKREVKVEVKDRLNCKECDKLDYMDKWNKCDSDNDSEDEDEGECECNDCNEKLYEGCNKCFESGEWECKKCGEDSNVYNCSGCKLTYNVNNVYMYKLSDRDNEYVCGECINDTIRYM